MTMPFPVYIQLITVYCFYQLNATNTIFKECRTEKSHSEILYVNVYF
jgi:hypothetical protein